MRKIVGLLTMIFYMGCNYKHTGDNTNKNIDSIKPGYSLSLNDTTGHLDTIKMISLANGHREIPYSCDSLIGDLISGSGIDAGIQAFNSRVLDANKDSVLYQYYALTNESKEYTIALILILPCKNELLNISTGLIKPVSLSFNEKAMKLFKLNCEMCK